MTYCKHETIENNHCIKCNQEIKPCLKCKGNMRKVRIKKYDYMPFEMVYQCYNCLEYDY